MLEVETIATPELGDRSYIAHDSTTAVVVDPQRDLDRVEEVLDRNDLSCVLVLETHLHNDYLTGGYELARRTKAEYALAAADDVEFERRGLVDGDVIDVDGLAVRVLSTPGHTFNHVSYVIDDGMTPPSVFTGGSLLCGNVGRTDLLGAEHAEELARLQYHSVRRLAELLDDQAAVYPSHGFGSFCAAGPASTDDGGTIGAERARNVVFTVEDEDTFVTRLLSGYGPFPSYYAHMTPENRKGPGAVELSPVARLDPESLRRRVGASEWVVDLRDRVAYARAHLAGTYSFPLEEALSTYLGWLIPWGAPLSLIANDEETILQARRDLSRIGIDRIISTAGGPVERLAGGEALRSYPVVGFADLAAIPGLSLIDVRLDDEWEGGHFNGAFHLPIHELAGRTGDLPPGRLAVHCASGYRAAIAASIIDRLGRDVVLVNDSWVNAPAAGLEIITG